MYSTDIYHATFHVYSYWSVSCPGILSGGKNPMKIDFTEYNTTDCGKCKKPNHNRLVQQFHIAWSSYFCSIMLLVLDTSGQVAFREKTKPQWRKKRPLTVGRQMATWRNVIPIKQSTERGKKFQRPEEIMHGRENEKEVD